MARLSDATVRALVPGEKQRIVQDDSLAGFGVRVSPQGTKAFVLTYGQNRERVTIGRYPIISLQDARTEAKRILAERTLGKTRNPRKSLSSAFEEYYRTHGASLRPRTLKEIQRLFKRYFPTRGNLEDITVREMTKILDGISSPSEAEHFHRAAKTFFRWCVERHLVDTSPVQNLRTPSKWKPRERVLSDEELRAIWQAAPDNAFGKIVRLLVLLGTRRSETAAIKPEWINDGVLTIPASFTKNKHQHSVPIPTMAQDYLPLTYFNAWSKSKAALDAVIKIKPWVLHDLRKAYAVNMQRLGVQMEVIENLLNHKSGTRAGIVGVYQIYSYDKEMREAVEKFETWFRTVIASQG